LTPEEHTRIFRSASLGEGFSFIGFSKADFLAEEEPRLSNWLKKGMHGKMTYMENHFDKRLDPRKLVEGGQSVVSLMFNYFTEEKQTDSDAPKISIYAYGEDYHSVIKDKLSNVLEKCRDQIGDINARIFVDSAPVLDKAWAKRSGLGWMGKNTNIINKQQGSFFFLAEIICDIPFVYDGPIKDYCGTCTACIDHCPTEAIPEPYIVDGSKCISYFTIELKDAVLPSSQKEKFENWMFGCDICQDVCPWNRFSKPHAEPRFTPDKKLMTMSKSDWQDLTEDVFSELFRRSAVKRTKFEGLKRNIRHLS
jgi:epoxyqueuosine reductase